MKRTGVILTSIIVLLVILGGGFIAYRSGNLPFGTGAVIKDSGNNVSDYTAVFLTNGQVYFGKMVADNTTMVDLRDIYYLQVNQNPQDTTKTDTKATDQNQVVLVKLGEELHGPTDRMRINKNQVIFTESVKSDSRVVKAIQDYQNKK